MPTLPGSPLGPYHPLPAISAGASGEVCHARGTRPDPALSFQVPPSHLAERAELPQLEREAQTRLCREPSFPFFSLVRKHYQLRCLRQPYRFLAIESQNEKSASPATRTLRVTSFPFGKGQP